MKKIILLLSTLFSFSFFLTAQSIDKALEQLETVRLQNGEQSQEYLSALDTVILKVNMAGDLETAFNLRKKHLEILKLMKGDVNIEVAEDLWRLGNTSRRQGDVNVSHNYYIQATDVFDKIFDFQMDSIYVLHYALSLYTIIDDFVSLSEREQVSYYSPILVDVSRILYKNNNCGLIGTLVQILTFNNNVGNANESVYEYYCKTIVNESAAIDSCSYSIVNGAYDYLKYYYFETKQYNLQIETAKAQVNKLDEAKVPLTKELIIALYYLLANENKKIEEAIIFGKRAEKMLEDSRVSTEELYQDTMYYKTITALANAYGIIGNNKSELSYNQLRCNILEYNNRKESKEYYEALKFLLFSAYRSGEFPVVIRIAPEFESMIFNYSDTPSEDALMYAETMAYIEMSLGNYKEAIYYYDEALELLPQTVSGELVSLGKAYISFAKAQVFHLANLNQDALTALFETDNLISKLAESPETQSLKVGMFMLKGDLASEYSEAMAMFDTAYCINEQLLLETSNRLSITNKSGIDVTDSNGGVSAESIGLIQIHKDCLNSKAKILLNKGKIQYQNGAITDAYHSHIEASSIIDMIRTENSDDYIACQHGIASCQMEMGNISDAINTLDRLLVAIKEMYGEKHPSYASILLGLASYYSIIGDCDKVIDCGQKAAFIYKEIGETDGYAQAILSVGAGFLLKGDLSNASYSLLESCGLMEAQNNNPKGLRDVYENLFKLFCEMNRDEEAVEYFNKAAQVTESAFGKQSIEYAKLATQAGSVLLGKGYEIGYDALLEATNTMILLGLEQHPLFLSTLLLYGIAGEIYNKPLKSDFINTAKNAFTGYYVSNIGYFSSIDRGFLWKRMSTEAKNIIFSARTNDLSNTDLFDYLLFSKSLMLSTSDSFKKAILATGQQHLIDQFNDIQALQRAIDNQSFGLSMENQPLEQLYDRKNSMERKLLAEMKSLGYSINDSITYNDISKSLKDNEIAIEFVDYYHLREKKIYYLALLAKSSWENPIYVLLCTEDELKNRIGNPNVTYSTDDLYRLLWQPLLEHVGDSCTVYFSPSGMLHTIAVESMYTPDGSCLSDKYNLVRLTSTRELCKAKQPKTYETGAIYGGLQYDVEQQRMAEVAAMNKTELEESPAFALRGDDRGNWNYLPGTLAEAKHIASIMSQANIGCGLYEGDMGSEESFKALSGGNTDIIHLATHGYFIEGEKADMNDFMNSLSPLAKQKTDSVIDPLLRSGLILSGGNNAWLGKEVPEGIEDGVLTALEISTMNLSGTDMVVMSACETGLGDITSDGVFGLQRAFKMAGVQTLVMSLWKVDDNATSLIMQTFYEHLLSGITKREAFRLAQAAVRAKYPEPYYWAGFIMLD